MTQRHSTRGAWLIMLASLITMAICVYDYYTPETGLIGTGGVITVAVAGLLMLLSFILLAAANVPGNAIKARVGHPMVAGVKVWAFAHLLANGTLADVILFGSFLVWAIINFIASRKRDRAAGVTYPVGGASRTVITLVAGTAMWAVFAFWLHRMLIGVAPFG